MSFNTTIIILEYFSFHAIQTYAFKTQKAIHPSKTKIDEMFTIRKDKQFKSLTFILDVTAFTSNESVG